MGSKEKKKDDANKFSDRIVVRKGKSLYDACFQKYAIKGETFSDQMINLAEYLLSGEHAEIIGECTCEGCSWYDGWDTMRNKPRCLNLSPPIDKRVLSRTSGKVCQQMQEEQIELQRVLGKNVTRKNVGVVLTMANKLNAMNAELEAVNRQRDYFKTEVARINRETSPKIVSHGNLTSEVNALRETITSKDSKIQALSEQVKGIENELAEFMKYDLRVDCGELGQSIWFFKECLPRMKKGECWKNCSSYRKLLVDGVSV